VRYVGVDTFVRAALIKVDAGRLQLPSDRTLHALVEHRYYGTQTLESQTPPVYKPCANRWWHVGGLFLLRAPVLSLMGTLADGGDYTKQAYDVIARAHQTRW
jgi:hypothetical protein